MSKGIQKLESGHYFIKRPNHHVVVKPYWQTEFRTNYLPDAKAKQAIHDALTESVAIHMRSDVPVGSFLSGGIDSSLIVSLAKEINPNIKTFSVGFEREGFSEVDVARETADALGVENHSYLITPEEFMQALPDIMWHVDDPLADPAAVPLYFVAREASKQVKVALSGEGADELFGGYNIYREPDSLRLFNHMPTSLKRTLKNVSSLLPDGVKGKDFLLRGSVPLEERYIGNAKIFEEAEKKGILNHTFFDTSYQSVTKKYYNEATFYQDQVARMQYVDINTWLKGDILLKADKMSMAHSLELRVPFLDNQVFDIASRLSKEQKVSKGTTKLLLRQAAKGIVPNHVVNRKKLGFPVPIRHWLKDEMYSWAKNIIIESETEDLLNKKEVLALLEQHASGRKDNSRKLWTILMFMLWYSINIEGNQELIKMKAI
jgi:asparagine synthase (glutamine-hydrolysing)